MEVYIETNNEQLKQIDKKINENEISIEKYFSERLRSSKSQII